MTSITIPEGVTSIGNEAFEACGSLTSATIPSSVTSIGYDTFSNCSSLTSVIIPSSLTSIGLFAFSNCSSLSSIYCEATVPPQCGTQVFQDVDKQVCKLYVPEGCVNIYKAADQWSDFLFISETTNIGFLSTEMSTDVKYYNLLGHKVITPQKGMIHIQNGKKFLVK